MDADNQMVHSLYKLLVNSGLAFSAWWWVPTLERQESAMASNVPSGNVGMITTAKGRRSMLKLVERMVVSFRSGVIVSMTHQWTTLSGSGVEDVRRDEAHERR